MKNTLPKKDSFTIALCGNPNVGKSTVFNELTGLNQHTGNWPGKTVSSAVGRFSHNGCDFTLVDLPGTYSLCPNSAEEEVTRDYICFEPHDVTVAVADATCLERNLNLILQVMSAGRPTVLCLNLMDEARRKGIEVDVAELSKLLGIPVVPVTARSGKGMGRLKDAVHSCAAGGSPPHAPRLELPKETDELLCEIRAAIAEFYPEGSATDEIGRRLIQTAQCGVDTENLEKFLSGAREPERCFEKVCEVLFADDAALERAQEGLSGAYIRKAEEIYGSCVLSGGSGDYGGYSARDRRIDRLLTSKRLGIPIMLGILAIVFWITIVGANYPSEWLSQLFDWIGIYIERMFVYLQSPAWLTDCIVNGIYKTLAWVVSVMLPPMAIFFPLFTIMEDAGLLPRIAFNLDSCFRSCGAHGKMALTMCMGAGCNACGVTGCRIIDSKRERLIAIITNNFIPCNGRFPTIIAMISVFITAGIGGYLKSAVTALVLLFVVLVAVAATWGASKLLSKTVLRGENSSFLLELPPFRTPQFHRVIVRSLLDRTLFVLLRAVSVAAPAGLLIWIMANINVGGASILAHSAGFFEPFGRAIGLDGIIIMAFLLGFPANEIVIPIILMGYLQTGALTGYSGPTGLHSLLVANGWTLNTAICMIVMVLFHYPCATTLMTVYKETKSVKWTALTAALPTAIGIAVCFLITLGFRIF